MPDNQHLVHLHHRIEDNRYLVIFQDGEFKGRTGDYRLAYKGTLAVGLDAYVVPGRHFQEPSPHHACGELIVQDPVVAVTPPNAQLLKLAVTYPPPQSWWDEKVDPTKPAGRMSKDGLAVYAADGRVLCTGCNADLTPLLKAWPQHLHETLIRKHHVPHAQESYRNAVAAMYRAIDRVPDPELRRDLDLQVLILCGGAQRLAEAGKWDELQPVSFKPERSVWINPNSRWTVDPNGIAFSALKPDDQSEIRTDYRGQPWENLKWSYRDRVRTAGPADAAAAPAVPAAK